MKKLFIVLLLLFTVNVFSQTTFICEKARLCEYDNGVYKNCSEFVYPARIEFNKNFDIVTLRTKDHSSVLFFINHKQMIDKDIAAYQSESENGTTCIIFIDFNKQIVEFISKIKGTDSFVSQQYIIKGAYQD